MSKENSKSIIIIPARWNSKRFLGKPLQKIKGKFLIQWVYERCLKCQNTSKIFIATDNEKIEKEAKGFGASVLMTSEKHISGTDRVWEATQQIKEDFSSIINVQGDEPLIDIALIDEIATNLQKENSSKIISAASPMSNFEKATNPNIVKVVINKDKEALYFSRNLIPHQTLEKWKNCYQHIGIYGFQKETLEKFIKLPPSHLEKQENLEQLRALENKIAIQIILTKEERSCMGVDTPQQAKEIEKWIK